MSITPLPGLSEDRYLFPSGMTETERMFVFTALAILIGDYLRRMFPPLAWWIIIPILCTLVIYVLFIRNARLTRGSKSLTLLEIGRSWSLRSKPVVSSLSVVAINPFSSARAGDPAF